MIKQTFNLDKSVFYIAIFIISILGAFGFGLYSGLSKNSAYEIATGILSDVDKAIDESPNLVIPIHFLQPAKYPGSGVTLNKYNDSQGDLIFLSGFFKDHNEMRLIRRNGEILANWVVSFSNLFSDTAHLTTPPASDWNIDLHGARILPDGSIIFNFEYGGLVKMDRCGEVTWRVNQPTHHSIDQAEGSGYWIPGRNFHSIGSHSSFPPYTTPFTEDTILNISEDGALIREISVPGLFYANNLEALLTSSGETIHPRMKWDEELVHVNSVSELKSEIAQDFPDFEAGDLLVSLRDRNMIFVFNPGTKKIKWWKIGPWVRQHDPTFLPGGKMAVFNNNTYRAAFGHNKVGVSDPGIARVSNILEYDFMTDEHKVLFGNKPGEEFLSIERGKLEATSDGGYLVTEFEGGRVFQINQSRQIIWEYINRYDNNFVGEITDAHIYPQSYFDSMDWVCS